MMSDSNASSDEDMMPSSNFETRIIIDELVTFMVSNAAYLKKDDLVKLMADFYSYESISKARSIIMNELIKNNSDKRLPKRKGANRCPSTLNALYDFVLAADPDTLPCFVAKNLKNLPSITPDSIDITV